MQQVTEACPKPGSMVQHTLLHCSLLSCSIRGTTMNAGLTKTTERNRTPIAAEVVRIDRLDRHGEQERERQDDNCVLILNTAKRPQDP